MMRKNSAWLFLGCWLCAPAATQATTIDKAYPCPDGGQVLVTGTVNQISGAVAIDLTTVDCVIEGIGVAATGTVVGTFKVALPPTTADVDLQTALTAVLTSGLAKTADASLTQTVTGIYDFNTDIVSAEVASYWSGSGKITIPPEQLIDVNKVIDCIRY